MCFPMRPSLFQNVANIFVVEDEILWCGGLRHTAAGAVAQVKPEEAMNVQL